MTNRKILLIRGTKINSLMNRLEKSRIKTFVNRIKNKDPISLKSTDSKLQILYRNVNPLKRDRYLDILY